MSRQTAAQKTTYYGITFPSKAEGARYLVLRDLLEHGTIAHLKVAACGEVPHFVLQPKFEDADGVSHPDICYTPDFLYCFSDPEAPKLYGGRVWHIEEVKGRKFDDYPLRKKMFLYHYSFLYVFHELRG